jgi:protein YibB
MPNISIVTAFYDIGRGDWTSEKGYPHYLQRSVDTYLERFSHLCKLKNDIVVFTEKGLIDRVHDIIKERDYKTTIVTLDPRDVFSEVRENIERIQKSDSFQSKISPHQIKNPEYWNKDYVLITNLKACFVQFAVENNIVDHDMVAWIDFGYCRSSLNIPESEDWCYNFDESKIHLFSYKPYDGKPMDKIISENDVYILGAKVVAHKGMWPIMSKLMSDCNKELADRNFVDDDQGLLLMASVKYPYLFELHPIPDHQKGYDCFVLFNEFNDTVDKCERKIS